MRLAKEVSRNTRDLGRRSESSFLESMRLCWVTWGVVEPILPILYQGLRGWPRLVKRAFGVEQRNIQGQGRSILTNRISGCHLPFIAEIQNNAILRPRVLQTKGCPPFLEVSKACSVWLKGVGFPERLAILLMGLLPGS